MDDDGANSTLPGCTQIFIVPAAIPEPGFSGEQVRVPVGIVIHDHEDFSVQIMLLEVVPIVLRCLDGIADKNHFGIGDFSPVRLHAARHDKIVPLLEGHLTCIVLEGPLRRLVCR